MVYELVVIGVFVLGFSAGVAWTLRRSRSVANTSIFISNRQVRLMLLTALERKFYSMPSDELLSQIDAVNDAELGDYLPGFGPIRGEGKDD